MLCRLVSSMILGTALIVLPRVLYAADYYVSPTGGGVAPYDSWSSAAGSIGEILTLALGGNDTIYISPGTYSSFDNRIVFNHSKFKGLTITGAAGLLPRDATATVKEQVVIEIKTGTDYHAFYSDSKADNITIKNLSLSAVGSSTSAYINGSAGIVFQDVIFKSCTDPALKLTGSKLVSVNGPTAVVAFERCRFRSDSYDESLAASSYITTGDSQEVTVDYSIFTSRNVPPKFGVWGGSGETRVRNCVLLNNLSASIYLNSPGTIQVVSSVLGGNADGQGYTVYRNTAGDISLENCLVFGLPNRLSSPVGILDGGGNIEQVDAGFRKLDRKGVIVPCIDDGGNLSLAKDVQKVWKGYGINGTFYYDSARLEKVPSDAQGLMELLTGGSFEIGSHSHSHNPLNATVLGTLVPPGEALNPAYHVDLINQRFVIRADGLSHSCVVDLKHDGSEQFIDVLSQCNAQITGGKYQLLPAQVGAVKMNGVLRISSLRDTGGVVDISVPIQLDVPPLENRFLRDEIGGSKSILEKTLSSLIDPQTNRRYTVNSFANPYGFGNPNIDSYARMIGYSNSRYTPSGVNYSMLNYNLYKQHHTTGFYDPSSEVRTRKNTSGLCMMAAANGTVVFMLGHNTPVAYGPNSWETISEVLAQFRDAGLVEVMSAQQLAERLREGPWTYDPGTGIATRKPYGADSDLRTREGSPLRDAGRFISELHGGSTPARDLAGVPVLDTPDIGAFEAVTEPPVITANPSSLTRFEGEGATFSVAATGISLSYLWMKDGDDLKDGDNIRGAATAELTILAVKASDVGQYSCVVSNDAGLTTSCVVTLLVYPGFQSSRIRVITQPSNTGVLEGERARFSVKASEPRGGKLLYQWWRGGIEIPGASHANYRTPPVTAQVDDGAEYRCIITSSRFAESLVTEAAKLTVQPIVILSQPLDIAVKAGAGGRLRVRAKRPRGAMLRYQWEVWDGSAWHPMEGETKSRLILRRLEQNVRLRCGIYLDGGAGPVYSAVATVLVNP